MAAGSVSYGSADDRATLRSVLLCSNARAGSKYRDVQKVLAGFAGPAMISLMVPIGECVCCGLVFWNAVDMASMILKGCGATCGFVGLSALAACRLIDPGSPVPDSSDSDPTDVRNSQVLTREQTLPDGRTWTQRFCNACRVWQPHRCRHCEFCDRCILRLDRHCVIVGACVGERNQRFFIACLLCAGFGMLCVALLLGHCVMDLHWWMDAQLLSQIVVMWSIVWSGFNASFMLAWATLLTLQTLADIDVEQMARFDGFVSEVSKLRTCPGAAYYC